MTSIAEVIDYLADRIGLIYYYNARAYGGDAQGVNTLLRTYHEVWAEIVGRYWEFRETCSKLYDEDVWQAARVLIDEPSRTQRRE